jgi:hypothetical protein
MVVGAGLVYVKSVSLVEIPVNGVSIDDVVDATFGILSTVVAMIMLVEVVVPVM